MDQKVHVRLRVYKEQNNIYTYISDITKDSPVTVSIYEEERILVAEGNFFFFSYLSFPAKKNASYSIHI